MSGELTEREIEISHVFDRPDANAFYVTKPFWKIDEKNIIDEDSRYVMGSSYSDTNYIPLPWEIFRSSIENLARRKALRIDPSDLYESIDFDPLACPRDVTYILDNSGVFIRVRNDRNKVHTMKMIGNKDTLTSLAKEISLPNPFNPEEYSFKEIFADKSGATGKIIFLS